METLRLIGYWQTDTDAGLPDPRDFVDLSWDEDERFDVAMYVGSGTISRTYMGFSPCRFCGQDNGAVEFTDGVFTWPSGLGHYIDDHGIRLPQEFVEHVRSRFAEISASDRDLSWWRSATDR